MAALTNKPWYRRAVRWGQTNITELDPIRYDIAWWRRHWQRTRVQGLIVNAGGIVAYYPSALTLQHRAEYLGDRDLFGEVCAAARAEGLAVLARMDSNRTHDPFYQAHPDWFAVDAAGHPYRAGNFYITCIQSAYYEDFIPTILREIIDRYRPDGFADNSWSGLSRDQICYCENCRRKFHEAFGLALPKAPDWDDPAYRQWIQWSYQRRLEIWDLNNAVTKAHGGPDCLWIGMNSGSVLNQSRRLRDYKAICERSEMVLLDSQTRNNATGFQANGDMGKLIHGLLGWEKIVPESMAMYQSPSPTFRLASRPAAEARMWMVEGFAGGIQPWWHHISAYHEDRRQYKTAAPLLGWHADYEDVLLFRDPIATVGVLWSQQNMDFFGRDQPEARVVQPYNGVIQALIRSRIPYLPIHADHVSRAADSLSVLVLPNIGVLSDTQCQAIRDFVHNGGGLIASGESSLYGDLGEPRSDFALADLFGAHATGEHHGDLIRSDPRWDAYTNHSYLRLHPELRARVDGPQIGNEPAIEAERHPVLDSFESTDILPFGGRLEGVHVEQDGVVPLTYIPPFPIYPPETAWMRQADSQLPALILREPASGGRCAYLAANLDHCFGRDNLPDHGDVLTNLVRWAAKDQVPLKVEGRGLVDCHLYRQTDRMILHVVNLTHAGAWRAPLHELNTIGPLHVSIRVPADMMPTVARLLVAGMTMDLESDDGWISLTVPSLTDHEVVVIS